MSQHLGLDCSVSAPPSHAASRGANSRRRSCPRLYLLIKGTYNARNSCVEEVFFPSDSCFPKNCDTIKRRHGAKMFLFSIVERIERKNLNSILKKTNSICGIVCQCKRKCNWSSMTLEDASRCQKIYKIYNLHKGSRTMKLAPQVPYAVEHMLGIFAPVCKHLHD